MFLGRVVRIVEGDGGRIAKDGCRVTERNAVFWAVRSWLLLVPFEFHAVFYRLASLDGSRTNVGPASRSASRLLSSRYHSWYHKDMEVLAHRAAAEEYRNLPKREQDAMDNVIAKLRALGDQLPYPHSSAIKGAAGLRELRPRAGHSPYRAFYRCIGDAAVIGAFGPEAKVDPRGFETAVQQAASRLAAFEAEKR